MMEQPRKASLSLKHLGYFRKDEGDTSRPPPPTKNKRLLEAEGIERAKALTCTRNGEEACGSRAQRAGACLEGAEAADADFRYGGKESALHRKFKRKTEGLNKVSLAAVLRMNCKGTQVTAEGLARGIKALRKYTCTHTDLKTCTGYGNSLYLLLNFAMNLKVLSKHSL